MSWQLRNHCPNCLYFRFCHSEALHQFIPQLSRNDYLQLRTLKLDRIKAVSTCKDCSEPLRKAAEAISKTPRITVTETICNHFPNNSSAQFFIYLTENSNPESGFQGIALAWRENWTKNQTLAIKSWTIFAGEKLEKKESILRDFFAHWDHQWQQTVKAADNRKAHLFLFDRSSRNTLENRLTVLAAQNPIRLRLEKLLKESSTPSHTILESLLKQHFILPLPGRITLFAVNHILDFIDGRNLPQPETLWHRDPAPELSADLSTENSSHQCESAKLEKHLDSGCRLLAKLERWLKQHLKNQWHLPPRPLESEAGFDRMTTFQAFLKTEIEFRKRDIQALQRLPLNQHRARFRALGPLQFSGTILDDEGHFLYQFDLTDSPRGFNTKFRSDDFLKLAPLEAEDLQGGIPVILNHYNHLSGEIALTDRYGRNLKLNQTSVATGSRFYTLEEDAEALQLAKLLQTVKDTFSANLKSPLQILFNGGLTDRQPARPILPPGSLSPFSVRLKIQTALCAWPQLL